MMKQQVQGLALICDPQGLVLEVLRNDLGLANVSPGQLFFRIVESGSRTKSMNFLTDIKTQGAVLDWEMNVQIGEAVITLHFTGGQAGDVLLVSAASNGQQAAHLFEEMLMINNEQANMLRAVVKDDLRTVQLEPGQSLYEDISRLNNELVEMQRELARKNAELARLNELKNQFLGMAAHDLRNPLHAILAYSGFLLDTAAPKLDADEIDFLTTIRDQSQFMAKLVNDLLDVASIESGKLQLDLQPTDLVQLARTNLKRSRLIASRKDITLELQTAGVPIILLDAAKIEQVLDNLITNAIKFSPSGGIVNISIQEAEQGILLSVQDQGSGIPAHEIGKLFKPFQRTSVKSTAGEKGSGLGLVIAKRIVEGHGGRIWVESQAGSGTTFQVWLPLA